MVVIAFVSGMDGNVKKAKIGMLFVSAGSAVVVGVAAVAGTVAVVVRMRRPACG